MLEGPRGLLDIFGSENAGPYEPLAYNLAGRTALIPGG
jgi:hypothetical protein